MQRVLLQSKTASVATVDDAGTNQFQILHMANIKKYYDYTQRKDCFMGSENRRYWLVNLETGKRIKISEDQYHD